MAAVTVDKIRFYQPSDHLECNQATKPETPRNLHTPQTRSTRLRFHFLILQQSQPPETPENDFDRILEKMSLDDGSQPLGGNRRNTDEDTTIPSGLNLSGFSSDRLGMPVEADTAAESATEAGLHTCRSGGSRDLSLDLLTIRVFDPLTSALFQMATSESAGGQTSSPPLPAREAPTDQGDKLDRIADDDGALLTS
ncbi:hypothetical protein ACO22_08044 [Paracoccidioides brasiliensis]|uniref:Uncharacterized protein n=1 Tax=Paracoccidioides brasiliensis TaxID=121759 RepID=A0A1D2J2Z0_PARBR|nr:hypothetical protein ACO22_08044 [Paracoccidioides brasiliensis]